MTYRVESATGRFHTRTSARVSHQVSQEKKAISAERKWAFHGGPLTIIGLFTSLWAGSSADAGIDMGINVQIVDPMPDTIDLSLRTHGTHVHLIPSLRPTQWTSEDIGGH